MLSVSRGMSAGQAGGYFSREDYYLKEEELESYSGMTLRRRGRKKSRLTIYWCELILSGFAPT